MKLFFSFVFLSVALSAFADVRLPAIISDHMVLQQKQRVPLWGWCEPGEEVTITTSWNDKKYVSKGTATADFHTLIETPAAGGPYTITVKGYNTIVIADVMIGEVWLCSGQSNMEMNTNWGLPYEKEAAEANNSQIRFFHIPRTSSEYPQDDLKARWVVCTPAEMKKFSAVGYFFGDRLNKYLQFPIGLISASWGGTPAETWTPAAVVTSDSLLLSAAQKINPSPWWPVQPGFTYHAMIHPIKNFHIAGVLWYQGESNTNTWSSYSQLLTKMISSWRSHWSDSLPFYIVQIAPWSGYQHNISALLREQQTKVAAQPHNGMVVTHDLVDDITDQHPRNKKDVGIRLANYALADLYKRITLSYKSPTLKEIFISKNQVRIRFHHTEEGLMIKGRQITDLFIAGEDRKFYPALGIIAGSELMVSAKKVKNPVAVRYGFSDSARPNLYNKAGLPVAVFRTDDWD